MRGRGRSLPRPAAQIAGTLLALVLLGLAAYAIGMDRRSSAATAHVEKSILIARTYDDLSLRLLELERTAGQMMAAPSLELRADFDLRVNGMLELLDYLALIGTEEDRETVKHIRDTYLPALATVQVFFDAIANGRAFHGVLPSANAVGELQDVLSAPATMQRSAALDAVADLRAWQQMRVAMTVGVFAGGLGVVALLLLLIRTASRQAARTRAVLETLKREALTDSLTGVGNHRAFQEALRETTDLSGSLVLLDLDRFKEVNDIRGHAEGDVLLRQVATLLQQRFASGTFRIGGDEFAVLSTAGDVEPAVDQVLEAIRRDLPGITGSAGVTDWCGRAFDADLHFAEADAALRWAKREGRNQTVRYTEIADQVGGVHSGSKTQAVRRLITERTGVSAVFQPIWGLSGELRACEGLSRFDPATGLGAPEETFDIANQDGRTFELDLLCYQTILAASVELPPDVLLFINLSPQSLVDRRFSVEAMSEATRVAGRTPGEIVLEVTERAAVPLGILGSRIAALRKAGFGIALDDVGAGNSGLETLRRIVVDWIKIDRSILSTAPSNLVARGVMRALLAFAQEVNAVVVAEGIESMDELQTVLGTGNSVSRTPVQIVAQGYLLGHPAAAGTRFDTPLALRAPTARGQENQAGSDAA